jgi:AcrR family transcriptional regulator
VQSSESIAQDLRRNASSVLAGETRFERGDERPLGARGQRTRRLVLEAATAVFTKDGWAGASMAAIAEKAGVAVGTLYQYFRGKEEIISAIVAEWTIGAIDQTRGWDPHEGLEGLRQSIADYVDMYARTARFQRVWDEVSLVDPALGGLRSDLTELFVHSFADSFVTAAALGLVDPGPDPLETSRAILSMIDRYCLQVFVRPSGQAARARAAELLTALSLNALKAG